MKRAILAVFLIVSASLLPLLTCPSSAQANSEELFYLKGFEIFKGIDIGALRMGTTFAGEIYDGGLLKVGQWSVALNYKGAGEVEVCGGTNDIVSLKLTVLFSAGSYAGNTLILGMVDWSGEPDVNWNTTYNGAACQLGGTECSECGYDTFASGCSGNANIALIDPLTLSKQKGSTLAVKTATLINGHLCHYFPVIPRVYGELNVVFK